MSELTSQNQTPPPEAAKDEKAVSPEGAKTETPPAPKPEDVPSGNAKAAENSRDRRHETASNRAVVLEYVKKCIESGNPEMIKLAENEQHPDLKESAKVLETLLTNPDWQATWKKFDLLAQSPEYSKAGEKKREIMMAICLPVINGHLSAEDTLNLVSAIEIRESNTDTQSTSGYKGIFFYNPGERKLVIAQEALKDKYAETRNGQEVEIKLDLEHLIAHEMSHGLLSETNRSPRKNKEIARQITGAENPSNKMVARAKEIIGNAETYMDSQPMHVQAVLAGLKTAPEQFGRLSDQDKTRFGSLDIYLNFRKVAAADEIMTDYTAFYLQSDGSFEGFVDKCLDLTPTSGIANYLSSSTKKDGVGESDSLVYAKSLLRRVNMELSGETIAKESGNFASDNPENAGMVEQEENIPVRSKYPEIFKLMETYKDFYTDAMSATKETKGKVNPPLESSDEEEIIEPAMSSGEGSGGGSKQKSAEATEIANEFLGIAHHMLGDLGIVRGEQMRFTPTPQNQTAPPSVPTEKDINRLVEKQEEKKEEETKEEKPKEPPPAEKKSGK